MSLETKATITGCGLKTVGANDAMQAMVKLKEADGNTLYFTGFIFKKDTEEKNGSTESNLKNMGFPGFEDGDALFKLRDGDFEAIFDTSKVYDVVLEESEYNGKMYKNVKWINDPDKPKQSGKEVTDEMLMKKFGIAKSDSVPF